MCEMSGIGVHAHRRVPFVDRQTLIALPFIGERAQHIGGNFWCVTAASKRIAEAAEMAIFITTDRDVLATQVLTHNAPNYETRFHVDPLTRVAEGGAGDPNRTPCNCLGGAGHC